MGAHFDEAVARYADSMARAGLVVTVTSDYPGHVRLSGMLPEPSLDEVPAEPEGLPYEPEGM